MTGNQLNTNDWHEAIRRLHEILGAVKQAPLGGICRDLERRAADDGRAWAAKVNRRLVTGLLRSLGWRKIGLSGSASTYDRDTLYAKARVCRECGCLEHRACVTDGVPCGWADSTKTLCTACIPGAAVAT